MLNLVFKPHRGSLKAGTADAQKVFVMLKVIPEAIVSRSRPPLSYAFVVDTSGSMMASLGSHGTKLDQAIDAAHTLIDDPRLTDQDSVSVVHFDDTAKTLLPLTPLSHKQAAHAAVEALRQYSGGTMMGAGLRCAFNDFKNLPPEAAKRVLLLTDGETFDQDACTALSHDFADLNIPITTIGIGDDYNHTFLAEISNITRGRPHHMNAQNPLHDILDDEVGSSAREVVTDARASLALVKGIQVDSLMRVYPSMAEVPINEMPYRLGNIEAGDYTAFIFEFTISGLQRPPSRVRVAQLGLTANAPGLNRRDEFPPIDLFLNFSTDEAAIAVVDQEVIGYVQQKNVDRMVQEAVKLATVDAGKARQTLQLAVGMTQSLANPAMTKLLTSAIDELDGTGTISADTRKTVALGSKTKTIKTGTLDGISGLPSDEEIRKLTGV